MTYLEADLICIKVTAERVDMRFMVEVFIMEENNIYIRIAIIKEDIMIV